MKRIAAMSAAALALAACATEPNPTRTVGGQTQVQIISGHNCYDNKCFQYDAATNLVQMQGRVPASIPADIPASSGYVSVAQYSTMFDQAWRAETRKSNDR